MFSPLAFALIAFLTISVGAEPCTKPSVRREWRSMSKADRSAWIRAVKCLSHLPHDPAFSPSVDPSISLIPPVNASGSYYDDFVYMHMDLNVRIHFTGLFLPWHRWYVNVYETALKEKCGYEGSAPYWNWSQDSADVYDASIFQESDPTSGLGGWGNPAKDYSVPDGGFSDLHLSYPSPHTLRRNFTLQPYITQTSPLFPDPAKQANATFTPTEVAKLVNGFSGDYVGFQKYFEGFEGAHGSVHLIMGGDMGGTCPQNAPKNCTPGPTWSANEPMFWMHHAMVDKVWYDWQHKSPANFWKYSGGSVEAISNLTGYEQYPNGAPPMLSLNSAMPADGLFPEATIYDVMNTTGGFLCYKYE
ncbi:Di-copper centre-containing protein [Dentipellis sp. KUC8613]|nr:Di-copper centre-containing protein [Dentipellis sp. KUC8613]